MERIFKIRYTFYPANRDSIVFDIDISEDDLSIQNLEFTPEPWMDLSFHQCPHCPLKPENTPYCPAATAIQHLINLFKDSISFDKCEVKVEVPERTYYKSTSFQEAIRSILGIYMPISGCPYLEWLRPMVRFHLPFSSSTETLFRAVGSYLVGQFIRLSEGLEADWNLQTLKKLYENVHLVNVHFANRLRSAIKEDAAANSLVILDFFSQSVPFSIDKNLTELKNLFASYLK